MTQVCGIPVSRAYWELKAEQVMNRVFAPEISIDLEIIETPQSRVRVLDGTMPHGRQARANAEHDLAQPQRAPATAIPSIGAKSDSQSRPKPPSIPKRLSQASASAPAPAHQLVWMGGFSLMALLLAGGTLTGLGFWGQYQQSLQQERNMLLIERLRSLSPAPQGAEEPTTDQNNGHGSLTGTGNGPELPPPPPEEPWMQELSTLPSSSAPAARPLQVPLSPRITAGPPPEARPQGRGTQALGSEPPQLVGVIQAPGQKPTAIFQVAGTSANAGIGETIGSSGWQLRSATGDSVVIERDGNQRRLSISGSF